MSGAEKASTLAAFIETAWPALDKPCSERGVDVALRFAGGGVGRSIRTAR
jgi:hypothetical protein